MFEKATKEKYRFETARGNITTEDLWDMPLTNLDGFSLDNLAKSLNRALKESEEESFVIQRSNASNVIDSKLDIVKRVIEVKLLDIKEKENAVAKEAKKGKILDILADKEDSSLRSKSKKDLMKMLEDL